jgi:DNA ligase (NAD+)
MNFEGIDELAKAAENDLTRIRTIGPKTAQSIHTFFLQEGNERIIEKLKRAGLLMKKEVRQGAQPLAGIQFVVTGRMEHFSRKQAEDRIKELGGTAGSDVGIKTNFLVVGADPGSKADKARKLGTRILTEEEFAALLDSKKAP